MDRGGHVHALIHSVCLVEREDNHRRNLAVSVMRSLAEEEHRKEFQKVE